VNAGKKERKKERGEKKLQKGKDLTEFCKELKVRDLWIITDMHVALGMHSNKLCPVIDPLWHDPPLGKERSPESDPSISDERYLPRDFLKGS
jgi:hypothetical protein